MNIGFHTSLRRLALVLIVLLLAFFHLLPTYGKSFDTPVLPPAPTWNDAPPPQPSVASASTAVNAVVPCTGSFCMYLSFVARPENANQPRLDTVEIYKRLYIPSNNISSGWNGDVGACTPGSTNSEFLDAVKMRINYYREMAGVPPIQSLNSQYNATDQYAALMMSANSDLDHTPPTNWQCYTEQGATGAGRSNLALGMYGPGAIDGYMEDYGSGNTAAGHRRWILNPPTTTMGTGDIPGGNGYWSANALYVFDPSIWNARPATKHEFVAWPPPGYVPYNTVYARWTFAIDEANFSSSTVIVTSGGANIPVTLFAPVNGYGENTLVWQISSMRDGDAWPKPAADTDYTVAVHNVIVGGVSKNYIYTVTVFDPGP